jgi:hypothetical protein
MNVDRRLFLRAGAAAGVFSRLSPSFAGPQSRRALPPIPTVHDLTGDRIVHSYRDLYCSPRRRTNMDMSPFVEVRHCYDLLSVLDNMSEDLSDAQKQEMSRFFWRELHSDYWMQALSPEDVDATWNIRPGHSWLGAYSA